MDALQELIQLAKKMNQKPIINRGVKGLGVYTDDSGKTEWANLSNEEYKMRLSQLKSYLRSGQNFWLNAYIGHLEVK